MSKITSKIKKLWNRMASKSFRQAFAASATSDRLSFQIHSLRMSRGWTQERVAQESGMAQPRISALETDCHKVTLETLRRLANAYDVALQVKFVPYSTFLTDTIIDPADKPVPAFETDRSPMEAFSVWSKVSSRSDLASVARVRMSGHPMLSVSPKLHTKTQSPTSRRDPVYVH